MGERDEKYTRTSKSYTRLLVSSLVLGKFPLLLNFSSSSLRSSVSVLMVVERLRDRLELDLGVNGKGLPHSRYAAVFAVVNSAF